jgi:hypothetical protein
MNLAVSNYSKFFLASSLPLETTTLAGICLWSLALYLSFASLRERVTTQLERGLQKTVPVRFLGTEKPDNLISPDSPIFLYASLLSILPFFVVGCLCNYGVEISLGRSWAVSTGILACISCGVYELGRRSQ